jgi:hypothetical protein
MQLITCNIQGNLNLDYDGVYNGILKSIKVDIFVNISLIYSYTRNMTSGY